MASYESSLRKAGLEAARLHRDLAIQAQTVHGNGRVDVYGTIARLGVPLMFTRLDGLLGAYYREPSPGILVTTQRPSSQQRYTAAHELGHHHLGHSPTIWQVLRSLDRPVFLWNVFPFHPHEHRDTMSNRCHTRTERLACRSLLIWLLEALQPKSLVAIGRDAQIALDDLDISAQKVRHPSYGGQAEFISGMEAHYGICAAPRAAQGWFRFQTCLSTPFHRLPMLKRT